MLQEVERQRWEEHRKSQQEAAQTKAELARYEDELARQRSAAEHEKAKQRNAEMVSLQNENLRRQNEEKLRLQAQIEAERRATEQYRVSRWCCFRRESPLQLGHVAHSKAPRRPSGTAKQASCGPLPKVTAAGLLVKSRSLACGAQPGQALEGLRSRPSNRPRSSTV